MIPIEQGNDLLKYLPQRPPFVMVSELYQCSDKKITAGLKINSDNLMLDKGFLNEAGLVESMAQTAALYAGICAYLSAGHSAPIGYIASIKNLKINRFPSVGETIVTTVEMMNEVMNMQIAKAFAMDKEVVIAECEMRIFIKPEV